MATKRTRAAALYIGSNKIAEMNSSTWDHSNGVARQFGTEGLYFSEGQDTVDLSFDTVEPVAGKEVDIDKLVIDKEDVSVGMVINGQFEKSSGVIVRRSHSNEMEAGTSRGTYTFMGAKPERV